METRFLGRSGLRVTPFAFGSWLTFSHGGPANAKSMIDCAIDHGINFLDTADVYDNGAAESMMGQILTTRRRQHLVVATKVYWNMSDNPNDWGLSRKHIFESIDDSLHRLQTDYVDLYQCHRFDSTIPLDETVRAMGDLIRMGKVLYWGTSCWSGEQLHAACAIADELGVPRPISEQPPYNMLSRQIEDEVLPTCAELGIGVIIWSPLAQGFLSGKYQPGVIPDDSRKATVSGIDGMFLDQMLASEDAFTRLGRIEQVARDFSIPLPVLAVAWCLRRPELTSVILGASKVSQIEQNMLALEVEWTAELDAACEAACQGVALQTPRGFITADEESS